MNGWQRLLGLLVLLGVQGALAPHLALAGVPPDLPLAAVVVVALQEGPARGGFAGLVTGLALDLLRGTHLGLFALAAGAAGWLCGEAAARIDPGRASVRWLVACGGCLVYGGIVVAVAAVLDRNAIHATGALRHALLGAGYDGTLATIGYGLLALVRRRAGPAGGATLRGWPVAPPRRAR